MHKQSLVILAKPESPYLLFCLSSRRDLLLSWLLYLPSLLPLR